MAICSDKKACEAYRQKLLHDIEKGKKELEGQKMTAKQQANWLSQEEVTSIYKKLENEVRPLWGKEKLKKADVRKLMSFVALSCYVLIPPRRLLDFTCFKLKDISKDTDNYMDKYTFVFQKYKTAKLYGKQVVKIPIKVHSIITRWSKKTGSDWLLFNSRKEQMSQPQLNKLLEDIFDKKFSVNMLRHTFLTNKLKDVPDLTDLKETAQGMGHSLETQMEYKKKKSN